MSCCRTCLSARARQPRRLAREPGETREAKDTNEVEQAPRPMGQVGGGRAEDFTTAMAMMTTCPLEEGGRKRCRRQRSMSVEAGGHKRCRRQRSMSVEAGGHKRFRRQRSMSVEAGGRKRPTWWR